MLPETRMPLPLAPFGGVETQSNVAAGWRHMFDPNESGSGNGKGVGKGVGRSWEHVFVEGGGVGDANHETLRGMLVSPMQWTPLGLDYLIINAVLYGAA